VALDASHWIRSVARRYCELEADEQRMIAQDAGGEAQGCPMLAKDRCTVCTRKWRAAQLDDSGRQGSMPVQCRGASEMTLSRQTFSSGFQGLPALSPPDVWTGILTSTTEDMRRG
jgi:hypothetical protein